MKSTFSPFLLFFFSAAAMLQCSFALVGTRTSLFASSRVSHLTRYYSNDEPDDIASRLLIEEQRKQWIDRSVNYYSKVMREERRRNLGQAKDFDTPEYQDEFMMLAKKHYFALRKIKDGKPQHAEHIYRRIIDELSNDEDHCDHAKLAVTTLLLALLMQRIGDAKKTRSVFLNFFRIAVLENDEDTECACSAKVLQAYALFEMKQGNALKSLEIVRRAVQLDPVLRPVLNWKQFRETIKRRAEFEP